MRSLSTILLALMGPAVALGDTLENGYVRVTVDPARGGAITSMHYKKAASFPFIADKGAGVAATGRFFVPVLQVAEMQLAVDSLPLTAQQKHLDGETVLVLTGSLAAVSPGLTLERTIRLGPDESGFRIQDVLRNQERKAKDVSLRIGSNSRQESEAWCLNRRCWFGDSARNYWRFTPSNRGDRQTLEAKSPSLFWRVCGQLGVGFLYQARSPGTSASMIHTLPKEEGNPAELRWLSSPVTLAAGQTLTWESAVLIDEGGRQGNYPSALAQTDRVIAMTDLCAGGRSGEVVRGFGSVVSALPRKVKMVVVETKVPGGREFTRSLAEVDLTLEPGKMEFRPFEYRPTRPGLSHVSLSVLDERGKQLAVAETRAVIDGESATGELGTIWKRYTSTLPEVHARGTWEEIGAQLAKAGAGPFKPKKDGGERGDKLLSFYEKHFPYYAAMLKGVARTLQVTPGQLAYLDPTGTGPREACMGVFFNGPDGPLNAYSKERSNSSLNGLGYVKVLPDKGYPYHMYTLGNWSFGYGINSEGLCTSGATINCDARTEAGGNKATQAWKQAGKTIAPLGTHMMLAMCKDVEEALAFIKDPLAPFEFTGNMLLVDRQGNAAVLESVGIFHQVLRYGGKGVFATGNYPHERADGLFQCGSNWGWGANTMLRERFLDRILAERKGQISLKDALWIMDTHALPGGMCQHVFENPASLYTSTSYLAVARTGELLISNGPPCLVHYKRYTLGANK